jgi:hypothetical protein
MMKRVSFSDVLHLHPFKGMNQFDLLPPKMDSNTFPYLFKMGVDIDKPVHVQGCLHRNLEGYQVMGYSYIGLERQDKPWLNSRHSSLQARIAAQKDTELRADMINASREGLDWAAFKKMAVMSAGKDGTTSHTGPLEPEETYEEDIATMTTLRSLQITIRGPLHPDEDMINPPQGIA